MTKNTNRKHRHMNGKGALSLSLCQSNSLDTYTYKANRKQMREGLVKSAPNTHPHTRARKDKNNRKGRRGRERDERNRKKREGEKCCQATRAAWAARREETPRNSQQKRHPEEHGKAIVNCSLRHLCAHDKMTETETNQAQERKKKPERKSKTHGYREWTEEATVYADARLTGKNTLSN